MLLFHEILRLLELGYNQSQIAASTGHSRTSVGKVVAKLKQLKLTVNELLGKTDAELHYLFFPEEILGPGKRVPDFAKLRKELNRPGVTKMLLWQEYVRECEQLGEQPYGRSQFFELFRLDDAKANVTMHIARKPGVRLEVDWSGDTFPYFDGSSDKVMKAHIFVASMSYSQFMYVEAFQDERLESWITAHIHAFEFFGGVTKEIVPDNCKTAVLSNDVDGIKLNQTYREMSEHYHTIVLPARVKKPRDKPNAESSVGITQNSILAPLRDQQFYSLGELNLAIRNRLEIVNNQNFQKKEGSRRLLFDTEEKELLLPLPAIKYTIATWKVATVQCNGHIAVEKKFYSVPYAYIGKKVDVKISAQLVEVFFKQARIAVHQRSYDPKERYISIKVHLPLDKQNPSKWNGTSLREWAQKIGESTFKTVDILLKSAKHEQYAYRSCLALLSLTKTYSESLLELACEKALAAGNSVTFRKVKSVIILLSKTPKVQNQQEAEAANPHGLVRGQLYFEGTRE